MSLSVSLSVSGNFGVGKWLVSCVGGWVVIYISHVTIYLGIRDLCRRLFSMDSYI